MASTADRLTQVFQEAREHAIEFDDTSKFIFFSDCHRGDNGWSDDFAHNQILFWHALKCYDNERFTYVEIGDGDELWENRDFAVVRKEHDHIFAQMKEFYDDGRLYLIWGNHDIERMDPEIVKKQLHTYHDDREGIDKPLFPGITVHQGLVLRHKVTGHELFLVHGHQGSFESEHIWRISRHVVGRFWKPMQVFGVNDPTLPSQNDKKRHEVEDKIQAWIIANSNQPLVCGHTHRSWFSDPGQTPYFNTGSCVHPRCITGIELVNGEIQLIKWWQRPRDNDGTIQIERRPLVGAQPLAAYYR
jgi:UDP-2,3-diacylglucosamine pyrophosphatase LpxH